jgi:hypothetical protein
LIHSGPINERDIIRNWSRDCRVEPGDSPESRTDIVKSVFSNWRQAVERDPRLIDEHVEMRLLAAGGIERSCCLIA